MKKIQNVLLWLNMIIGLSAALDICEFQIDGVRLAHPADCSKYVVCEKQKTDRIISCPFGLHFNRFRGECDIRQRAGCDVDFLNMAGEEEDCSACCALYGCVINPSCPATPTPPAPECPDTTVTTETPNTPETSSTPDTPSTPECPDTPATPETPNTPETSSTPDTLSTPECPDTTATPETPDTPETPSTPDTSSTPAYPDTPTTPQTPATPGIPATPGTPSSSEYPDSSSTPETLLTPGTTVTSETTPGTSGSSSTLQTSPTPPSSETPPTPDTTATAGTPPAPETPSTSNPNDNCSNKLTVCRGKPNNSVFYVNGTCNQYIVCSGDCANIMTCPPSLQYNLTTHICDYPHNVDCPWASTPPATGPSGVTCAQSGKCANQPDGTMFTNPHSNGYIVCQCECEIERPCPAGTKFNEQLSTCASEGNSNENSTAINCKNSIEICKNQTDGTLLPVDGICNKFYKCSYGCAVEMMCPNNLVFNPTGNFCDYPQNYKCPWEHTPPSGPSTGPSGVACASGGRCIGKAEGTLYPSLNSCSKYVVCQCECEVEIKCSEGLLWDNEHSTCNYPSNVKCNIS